MRGSRVLVTGGAGLVGSHLTDLLVREGAAEVVVLDDFSRGTWANLAWAVANGPVSVIEGDVRDRDTVATAMRYVALRYFNVYGPRMDIHGAYTEVLIRWMERIAVGKPPLIFGDGRQTMDFVYVEDIARANLLAAEAEVTDMVFNIASGAETSLRELASELCGVMETTLE